MSILALSVRVGRGWNADWCCLTYAVDSGDVFDSRDNGAIEAHSRANENSEVAQAAISKEPSKIYDDSRCTIIYFQRFTMFLC